MWAGTQPEHVGRALNMGMRAGHSAWACGPGGHDFLCRCSSEEPQEQSISSWIGELMSRDSEELMGSSGWVSDSWIWNDIDGDKS